MQKLAATSEIIDINTTTFLSHTCLSSFWERL